MLEKKYTFIGKLARGIISKYHLQFQKKLDKREKVGKINVLCALYTKNTCEIVQSAVGLIRQQKPSGEKPNLFDMKKFL